MANHRHLRNSRHLHSLRVVAIEMALCERQSKYVADRAYGLLTVVIVICQMVQREEVQS